MVLVDGRVAGTWTHVAAKQVLRITVEPFWELKSKTVTEVRRRTQALAERLGLAHAEVVVATVR